MSDVRHPDVVVPLTQRDGNAYMILGATSKALRQAGVDETEVAEYLDAATAGDYDLLLRTTMQWVTVE